MQHFFTSMLPECRVACGPHPESPPRPRRRAAARVASAVERRRVHPSISVTLFGKFREKWPCLHEEHALLLRLSAALLQVGDLLAQRDHVLAPLSAARTHRCLKGKFSIVLVLKFVILNMFMTLGHSNWTICSP